MCAPNKIKKRNNALSYLFRIHLVITISAVVSACQAAWVPCEEWKFLSSSMNCMSMDSIIEVFYHLNKMLIATKHIAENNFVFQ